MGPSGVAGPRRDRARRPCGTCRRCAAKPARRHGPYRYGTGYGPFRHGVSAGYLDVPRCLIMRCDVAIFDAEFGLTTSSRPLVPWGVRHDILSFYSSPFLSSSPSIPSPPSHVF